MYFGSGMAVNMAWRALVQGSRDEKPGIPHFEVTVIDYVYCAL